MENKIEKLFAYGTLMDSAVQKEVFGRAAKSVSDILRGYKKEKIKIEGKWYPLIVPDKSAKVKGLVLEVTKRELEKIDDYETCAYKRNLIVLESGISAWVYVKNRK
jgi:gamma-glutamylcyclotransferase (GGCT)/AIG2-like uncharacterized protein YtfP